MLQFSAKRFPKLGQAYFQHLLAEAELSSCEQKLGLDTNPCVSATIAEILKKEELGWSDIFAFETAVLGLLDEPQLRRRGWIIRDRFRLIVGQPMYDEYLRSAPPALDKGDVIALRADLQQLLEQIHWRYAMAPVRESVRDGITRNIAAGMGLACVSLGVVYFIDGLDGTFLTGMYLMAAVLFMGAIGAFVSLQHRIQAMDASGDAIFNVLAMRGGRNLSVLMAPVSGAIFAALGYLLFASGFVKGDLFPDVNLLDATGIGDLLNNAHPSAGSDIAKLLVWCFVAGFAERLVPDALNRLVVRKLRSMTSSTNDAAVKTEPRTKRQPLFEVEAVLPTDPVVAPEELQFRSTAQREKPLPR